MNTSVRRTLAILFLLLCTFRVFSQVSDANYYIPTPFPKAPNTAAQEKFGSYDVNLYTGVPNISIPLYTIESGGLSVPITLSYHASGIKLSEVASWAGLGWSLSAGGNISRRIMGKADDAPGGYLQGYLRTTGSFNEQLDSDVDYLERIVTGTYDCQPDIFSYDFPGHNGKFFFDGNNAYKPALIPFAPISILNTTFSGSHYLTPNVPKFLIKDEHGNNYFFGYNTIETTGTATQAFPAVFYPSGWLLDQMVSQTKADTVSFSYSNQVVHSPDVTSQTYVITDNVNNTMNSSYQTGQGIGLTNSSSSTINEKLLSEIKFRDGKVVFEQDPSVRADLASSSTLHALKKIKVYRYNFSTRLMELQKTIVFYTSAFSDGSSRLRLDSLQILDKAGSIGGHYRFDYNQTGNNILPAYGSYKVDYWGYYNGKNNNLLIPQMTVPMVGTGGVITNVTIGSTIPNSREPDTLYNQANSLKRIYYPTGGYTDFIYQTNRYIEGGLEKLSGGLRIQQIKSFDGINPSPVVKSYIYTSSQKNFILDYSFFINSQQRKHITATGGSHPTLVFDGSATVRTFVANSRLELEPFDACPVGYPTVSEYIGTPSGNAGRNDYTFQSWTDDTNIASMTGIMVVNSYFFRRGQLLRKSEYMRKNDGSYQIVRTDSTGYTAFSPRIYSNVGLVAGKSYVKDGDRQDNLMYPQVSNPFSANGFLMYNYNIRSEDNYPTGNTIKIYDKNDPTKFSVTTTALTYNNELHQQVTKTRNIDSRGVTKVTMSKYAADYLSGNAVIDSMIARNMQADAIEKWDSVKNVATGVNGVSAGLLTQFKQLGAGGPILVEKIKKLAVSFPLNNFSPSTIVSGNFTNDSRYVQLISFDGFDNRSNITQYTARNSTPVTILWDYLNARPIAQVKNATSNRTAYTSFEGDGNGGWNYTPSGSKADVTTPYGARSYRLSAGGVSTINVDPSKSSVVSYWSNGAAASVYIYPAGYISSSSLKTVNGWSYYEHIIPSGASGTLVITGTSSIDELRIYPIDAQIATYTYSTDGLIQTEDNKGLVARFEYDPMQRLRNIKDWNSNIVKNFAYHNYDMTFANDAVSGTFTRDDCPTGTTPQSTTYSVASGTFYSSTKSSANLLAVYEMNTKGQRKANDPAVCGCPVQTMSFTLSNTTGLNGYQATFTGATTLYFNVPSSGTTTIQIPVGVYTLSVNPVGTFVKNFKLGNRTPVNGHNASFSNVNIAAGSTDNSLSIY